MTKNLDTKFRLHSVRKRRCSCGDDFNQKRLEHRCQACIREERQIKALKQLRENRKIKNRNKFKESFEEELRKYPSITKNENN